MIAVIYIICNLGYIANCIFSWGVTYKWLVIWKNTYLNIPEWLLKQIFSWIIQVLFAGYILRKQPWVPLHSLSLIFIVGSLEFFFSASSGQWVPQCHIPIGKMTSLIDIDCLRSQCRPPAINLYISEKTNPRSDVLLSQFRRGSARDRARGYILHFIKIKANFTLNISSGSLSHFLSQREK